MNANLQQSQQQEPLSADQQDYHTYVTPVGYSNASAANVQTVPVPVSAPVPVSGTVPVPQQQQNRNLGIPYEIHVYVHVPVHGEMKEIEFAYDSRADTPELLAQEMAQEFGLDKVYQDRICKEIEDQVRKQTGSSTLELYRKSHMPALAPPRLVVSEMQQYDGGGQVRASPNHANPSPQPPTHPPSTHPLYYQSSLPAGAVAPEQSADRGKATPVVVIGTTAKSVPTPPSDRSSPPHSGIYSRSAHDYPGIIATMQLRKSGGSIPRITQNESDMVAKTGSLKESKRDSHGSSNNQSVHAAVPVVVVTGHPSQQARSVSVDGTTPGTTTTPAIAAGQTRIPLLSPSSFSASGAAPGAKSVNPGSNFSPLSGSAGLASVVATSVIGAKAGVLSPKNSTNSVVPIQIISQQQQKEPISSSKSNANLKGKKVEGKQNPDSPQSSSRGGSETFSVNELGGSKHNSKMFQSCMALMEAASKGNIKGVKTRLAQGAPATFADYDKRTPLHLAASEGHAEIAELLIQHGADVEAVDRWGSSPMKDALKHNHMNVVDVLEEAGAEREVTDTEIMSYELLEFSARGLVDLVRERLMAGISADTADYDKRTPLHLAASEGHADVVELLLVNGAKISAKDRYGRTPVDDAINNGHRAVLLVLQRFGASIPIAASEIALSEQTGLGMDLVENSSKGRADVVQKLIADGAPVDWSDYDKRSALHLAVTEGHVEVVRLLLDAGAQFDITDRWDKTPFDDARNLKDPEISQQILGLLNQKLLEKTSLQAATIPKDSSNDSGLTKTDIGSTITSVDGEDIVPKSESFESFAAMIPPSNSTDALDSMHAIPIETIQAAPKDVVLPFVPEL